MRIFTASAHSWTVPGAHLQSFLTLLDAEQWLRDQFAEYLAADLKEELEDEDSSVSELAVMEDWFRGAADRAIAGTASMEDLEMVIVAVNELQDWSGDLFILESELHGAVPLAGGAAE